MEAGRELDEIVAEKVMGWTYIETDIATIWSNADYTLDIDALPLFSTDIAAAWQVVEHFRTMFPHDEQPMVLSMFHGKWQCAVACSTDAHAYELYIGYEVEAETAPLAICLAALKAKNIGVDVLAH